MAITPAGRMISWSVSALIRVSSSSTSLVSRTADRAAGPAHVTGDQGVGPSRCRRAGRRECSKPDAGHDLRPPGGAGTSGPPRGPRPSDILRATVTDQRRAFGCLIEAVETIVM